DFTGLILLWFFLSAGRVPYIKYGIQFFANRDECPSSQNCALEGSKPRIIGLPSLSPVFAVERRCSEPPALIFGKLKEIFNDNPRTCLNQLRIFDRLEECINKGKVVFIGPSAIRPFTFNLPVFIMPVPKLQFKIIEHSF